MEQALDIAEEVYCSRGLDSDDDFSFIRTRSTEDALAAYFNRAANDFTPYRIGGTHDKVVATCVNGNWVMPSHECLCHRDVHMREMSVEYFEMECRMEDRVITQGSSNNPTMMYSRYMYRRNLHSHTNENGHGN